jgi:large repetitive protein
VTVSVDGPNVSYHNVSNMTSQVGAAVSDAPQITNWTAPTDGTVLTWSYSVAGASLPPGLTLNATTGVTSVTATSARSYSVTIQPVLSTVYGSFTAPTTTFLRTVRT